MPLTLHAAAGCDVGHRPPPNQDSAITTARLLAVADGMGGHARGDVASAVAVHALAALDQTPTGAGIAGSELRGALARAITRAADDLTALARADRTLRGCGTTLVALLFGGARVGVLHIGDSRAYVLRDRQLHRLTRDHTLVQALLDAGRISAGEAADHARRSMLTRALQEGTVVEPDLFDHEGRPDDRYLLCTDGVTAVVPDCDIRRVLATEPGPVEAVDRLVELAYLAGAPDNITCLVADLVDRGCPAPEPGLVLHGAAARLRTCGSP